MSSLRTAGITIEKANYTEGGSAGLYVEFHFLSITKQQDDLYRVQIGNSSTRGSFVKKWVGAKSPIDDKFVTLYEGGVKDAITALEHILNGDCYHWTYLAFARYVAGLCDAMRKVK